MARGPRNVAEQGETPPQTHNDRGIIAESYSDLQGLPVLAKSRTANPLPAASSESTLRAIFQAAEIALLNLADLLGRATEDLKRGDICAAACKCSWLLGFHRVAARLSILPGQLGTKLWTDSPAAFSFASSPAYEAFRARMPVFDSTVLDLIQSGALDAAGAFRDNSLGEPLFQVLHFTRVGNHEAALWERNFAAVLFPSPAGTYEKFVDTAAMREAVFERTLQGDTFFTQFRGLHQIPEILGEEMNDHLEPAIRALSAGADLEALEHLSTANVLSEAVLASLAPITENLALSDYHEIRENLGLTSGSHSVCLRFHMFTHLYEQLAALMPQREPGEPSLAHLVTDEILKFRAFVFHWRDEHLHLPRNNLGGSATKSLTGSPDAIAAVRQMRDAAKNRDPLRPLFPRPKSEAPLADYFASDASLDSFLLNLQGEITQERFPQVQDRSGYFASQCPFSPPPRRVVT